MRKGNKYYVVYFQNAEFKYKSFNHKKDLNAFLFNFTVIEPGDEIAGVFYGDKLSLKEPVNKLSYELEQAQEEEVKT